MGKSTLLMCLPWELWDPGPHQATAHKAHMYHAHVCAHLELAHKTVLFAEHLCAASPDRRVAG